MKQKLLSFYKQKHTQITQTGKTNRLYRLCVVLQKI
jgi:hypothetical protein